MNSGEQVTSYVFYLFFVHAQDLRDRKSVAGYIRKHAVSVYGDCQGILQEVASAIGKDLDFDAATEREILEAFSSISTSSGPNAIMGPQYLPATWFQFFTYRKDRTDRSVKKVLALGRLVQPSLANALVVASDHHFLSMIADAVIINPSNPTLEAWGPSYFGYLEACRKVKAQVEPVN
jgi:hypothetical protein